MKNSGATNERQEDLNRGQKRLFGKDITNQVKLTELQINPMQISNIYQIKNNFNGVKNNLRIIRGKNQSMDENLLKKNLMGVNSNKNVSNLNNFNNNHINNVNNLNLNLNPLISHHFEMNKENLNSSNTGIVINNFNNKYKLPLIKNIKNVNTNDLRSKNNLSNVLNVSKNKSSIFTGNNIENNINNNSVINSSNNDSDIHMKTVNSEEDNKENKQFCLTTNHNIISLTINYNPLPYMDYIEEIYQNLLEEESEYSNLINFDYMKLQEEINEKMRVILIEWIVDVYFRFRLKQDTFFITVYIIDRFLSKKKILRQTLQLLGAGAILIACKYEEIFYPEIRDFVYAMDKVYTQNEILKMESEILTYLEFFIIPIFPKRFLEIISHFLNLSEFDLNLCNLMLELIQFDYNLIKYSSSVIACTCVYVTLKIKKFSSQDCFLLLSRFLNVNVTSEERENSIKDCAKSVCYLMDMIHAPCFIKIKEKYMKKEFCEVANFNVFN